MKVNNGSAAKKIIWALSFGCFVGFCSALLTSCASGDKKAKGEEVGADDAGDGKKDHKKKKPKKGAAAKKHDKDKDKEGGGDGGDAKDPM